MSFSKKDFWLSVITGFYTGFIAWRIFVFLGVPEFYRVTPFCSGIDCILLTHPISWAWLMAVIPVLWILGINLGYFLGRWFKFFTQFGKFSAIGFTNAAVDFGVLNLLIFYSGIAAGVYFSVFKAVSFLAAALHSYFWNKHWAFGSASREPIAWNEFFKFFGITVIAAIINTGSASAVVNIVGPQFELSSEAWANVGAVIGSAIALIASFIGFKKIVFRK